MSLSVFWYTIRLSVFQSIHTHKTYRQLIGAVIILLCLQSWINGVGQACEKGLEALIRHSCFWRGAKHSGQLWRKVHPFQSSCRELGLSEDTGKEEDHRFLNTRVRLRSWLIHSCGVPATRTQDTALQSRWQSRRSPTEQRPALLLL